MATLKQKIQYARSNPNDADSIQFTQSLVNGSFDSEAEAEGIDLSSIRTQQPAGETGLKGFATGFTKGLLSTVKGAGELGTKIGQATLDRLLTSVTGEGLDTADIFTKGTAANIRAEEILEAQTGAEKAGKFVEQVGEFAVPGSKVVKAGRGASLARKLGTRATTSGGVASIQEGEIGKETAIAGAAEILLPIGGKAVGLITKKTGKIVKNLLAGLGAPIEEIAENPQAIDDALKALKPKQKAELTAVLTENTKKITNGLGKIRKDAGAEFRKALEGLKETKADITGIRKSVKDILPKHGIDITDGRLNLDDAEFLSPSIRKRASGLISTLNSFKDKSGKGVRDMVKQIELKKFKNPGADSDKLAFNAFMGDLDKAFKSAVPELKAINQKFSNEVQLAEAIENTLGKLKFKGKNLTEFQKASEKIKALLKKSDIGAENVDDFLTKIGLEPSEFRAEEAVRRVVAEPFKVGSEGFNPFEIITKLTAGIIDPSDATRLASSLQKLSNVQQSKLVQTLQGLKDPARAALVKSIINIFGD